MSLINCCAFFVVVVLLLLLLLLLLWYAVYTLLSFRFIIHFSILCLFIFLFSYIRRPATDLFSPLLSLSHTYSVCRLFPSIHTTFQWNSSSSFDWNIRIQFHVCFVKKNIRKIAHSTERDKRILITSWRQSDR